MLTSAKQNGVTGRLPVRWRVLGLVPLAIFLIHFHHNASRGNPGNGLWMCHVSNLTLGLGLLCAQQELVRLATIWLLPGVPLWTMDTVQRDELPAITFFSHLAGPVIGLVSLRVIRASRWTWLYAFLWFLFIQQLSRVFTAPELNVNVAHTMYPGWERVFGAYWQYWLFIVAGSAVMLWAVGRFLLWFAPPPSDVPPQSPGDGFLSALWEERGPENP